MCCRPGARRADTHYGRESLPAPQTGRSLSTSLPICVSAPDELCGPRSSLWPGSSPWEPICETVSRHHCRGHKQCAQSCRCHLAPCSFPSMAEQYPSDAPLESSGPTSRVCVPPSIPFAMGFYRLQPGLAKPLLHTCCFVRLA